MKIVILIDYNNKFESKHFASPIASGMDKALLTKLFKDNGFRVEIKYFSEIDFYSVDNSKNTYYIYTSSEDKGNYYKDYIEDIIFGIEQSGGIVIPSFKFLRAHNNKLFSEVLRGICFPNNESGLRSFCFGSLDEFVMVKSKFNDKFVIKKPHGAKSRGVYLANGANEIINVIKKISVVNNLYRRFKEFYRKYRYKGYKPTSKYRKKFIVQEFISDLNNDWKVLLFWDKAYVLYRENRENDFRASGSGKFKFLENELPDGILDYAYNLYKIFDIPFVSLDIAHKNGDFYMIEYQALFFGKTTLEEAPFCYIRSENGWILKKGSARLEKEYTRSIIYYIKNKYE